MDRASGSHHRLEVERVVTLATKSVGRFSKVGFAAVRLCRLADSIGPTKPVGPWHGSNAFAFPVGVGHNPD